MAGDLQATLEISVEFSTFHNVDLFQRGYYQIRCTLKPPDKAVSCIDVEYRRNNGDYQPDDCLYPAMITPTGLTAISKTFQILYRNEDIILSDSFIFRLNLLVDSNKVTEQIDQTDVQVLVELFFSDAEVGPESPESLVSVSSQVLKLHLSCVKGLHHHVPVLFDYFHFAVIDTTIHAMLVKLSLPDPSILKMPKSSWFSKNSSSSRVSTPLFYAKLFGNKPMSNILSSRTPAEERQIRFAYDTHRSLCSTLLSAQVNLLAYFECLTEYLPTSQQLEIGSLDFGERLESLTTALESIQNPNEVFSQICSDLDNVSMEVSLVWSQFIESFTLNKRVLPHFRDEHHRQRIGHFSEAFFLQEFSWDELQIHQEQSFQMHQSLGQGIKSSRYYQTIPTVAVECPSLDGDTSSTPIIFEDRYCFSMPEHEEASNKSELDDIELQLDTDGCQNENADGDDNELLILETDLIDTPASQDDPNSSFALSSILCNGERPIRETMILDDDFESENNDLSKVLDAIQHLDDKSKPAKKTNESSKLSSGDDISGNKGCSNLDYNKEEVGSCSAKNPSGQSMNLISSTDIASEATVSEEAKEDEAFLMDLSLQKALIEQYESQKSKDLSNDQTDSGSTVDDINSVTTSDLLQCSMGNDNSETVEISNSNKASELDMVQQAVLNKNDLPCPEHHNEIDNNNIVSDEEVEISLQEERDGKHDDENTSNNLEVQIEGSENDTTFNEKEFLAINQEKDSPLETSTREGDEAGMTREEEASGHIEESCNSELSSDDNNQCNSGTAELPPDSTASSSDEVLLVSSNEEPASSNVDLIEVNNGNEKESVETPSSERSENTKVADTREELDAAPSKSDNVNEPDAEEKTCEASSSCSENIKELDDVKNIKEADIKDNLDELFSSDDGKNTKESITKEKLGDPPSSSCENTEEFDAKEVDSTEKLCELSSLNNIEDSKEPLNTKDVSPTSGSLTEKGDSDCISSDNQNDSKTVADNIPDLDEKESNISENNISEQSQNEVPLSNTQETLAASSTIDDKDSKNIQETTAPSDKMVGEVNDLKPSSSQVTFFSAQEATSSDSIVSDSHSDGSVYETPSSSQTTISPSGNTVATSSTDGPKNTQQPKQEKQEKVKKVKKKLQPKGLGITGCLPVSTCAGNTSPSFSRGNSTYGGSVKSRFELAKRFVKRQLKFCCQIYSDIGVDGEREAYFNKNRPDSVETHLIVCVHGLDGNSGDLRLFRCYLEMALPSTRIDFLMSEVNQGDTFVSFEELTDRLVQEILHFIDAYSIFPSKISFVGHSLGNIIIRSALTHPDMRPLLDRMYTLLSLSGPHVGMLYPTSPLVSTGLWLMQKWKKSEALMQLSLNDHENLRQSFIYRLSQSKGFEYFKHVLLVSSVQDHYVPYHSARIEMCKAAVKDNSEYGTMYREMISNLLSPLKDKKDMTFIRYSCYHALASSANSFIGRAAHIAMLDSELFIEKLLLVSALDYFM